jgi:hypothetical protein
MTEAEEKKEFAALLIREVDPFKVGNILFPENINRALKVANFWPNDPEVKAEIAKLKKESGGIACLPDKTDLARDIWVKMQGMILPNGTVVPLLADDYAKLAKLYAEVRGFIDKTPAATNVNVILPKAIEVPTFNSDEEWATAAEKQQREILNVSRSKH